MILDDISNFILDYDLNQESPETIQMAKFAFLDFLGVTLGGSREEPSIITLKTLKKVFSKTNLKIKSSVIGSVNKLDILNSGFINGISAHNLELDDGHKIAQMHLGSVIFPTAISISEGYNLEGRDFLEAVILGYNIGIFLGSLVNPQHRNNGFHTSGTIGTFVAGAVASKLLNFNKEEILNTLGLCGTQAAGLLESGHSGSMGKPFNVGKAVYNGILASELAKNGFTGSNSIFDGKNGFLNSFVFKSEILNKKDIMENINSISLKEIYFKKYPFCRHLHSSIDTALKLRNNICEEYGSIDKILIKTYDIASQHNNFNPKNREDLKHSLPYAVAIAIVCGELSVKNINNLIENGLFEENTLNNKVNDIKIIANKIKIDMDPELNALFPDKRPSTIIIKLDERFRGGLFQNTTLIPKGDIENPLSLNELLDKFKSINPHYDISNLSIIDNIENYPFRRAFDTLNK